MRKLDYQAEIDRISAFLRDYSAHSGFGRYIIGVSGGSTAPSLLRWQYKHWAQSR